VQNAIPHPGFYVIRVHDLTGSFSAVPGGHTEKQWREFFRDPWKWWDHRSQKVSEHQICQSSHVNAAIALVGVNLFSLCRLLLSCPGLNSAEILSNVFLGRVAWWTCIQSVGAL
jgi:hypothetical protein